MKDRRCLPMHTSTAALGRLSGNPLAHGSAYAFANPVSGQGSGAQPAAVRSFGAGIAQTLHPGTHDRAEQLVLNEPVRGAEREHIADLRSAHVV